MARRMLHDAAVALEQGIEPPALDASEQRVRPAGVLLPKGEDPMLWAKAHLANGLDEPVFSI
jgi:phthalate 4,5-dioxygenase